MQPNGEVGPVEMSSIRIYDTSNGQWGSRNTTGASTPSTRIRHTATLSKLSIKLAGHHANISIKQNIDVVKLKTYYHYRHFINTLASFYRATDKRNHCVWWTKSK